MKYICFQPLIGGMAIGAYKAFGCKPEKILSFNEIENEKHIRKYWPDVPYEIVDKNLEYNFDEIDVVTAVPVCAGLSMLNSGNRGCDAEQNNNMYEISEFTLKQIKPKAYIFENAPNLYTGAGEKVRNKLIEIANKYNYSISFIRTNTIFHGLPQKRQRTFVIFWNSKTTPKINGHKCKYIPLVDFLKNINCDIEKICIDKFNESGFIKYLQYKFGNTWRDKFSEYSVNRIAPLLEDSQLLYDEELKSFLNSKELTLVNRMIKKIAQNKHYMDFSPIYFGKDCTNAVVGSIDLFMHPTEDRYLCIRELMSLMGLPDDFEFDESVPYNKCLRHITQNVPVNTAKDWHEEIAKFLNNELELSDEVVSYFDNTIVPGK